MTNVKPVMGYEKQMAEAVANFQLARAAGKLNPLSQMKDPDVRLEGQVGVGSRLDLSTTLTAKTSTLVQAQIVGDNPTLVRSAGINLTFAVLGSPAQRVASLAFLRGLAATIVYGEASISKVAIVDVLGEPTISIPASFVTVEVLATVGGLAAGQICDIGCYATLGGGDRQPHTSMADFLNALAPAATQSFTVPPLARRIRVYGTNPIGDSFLVNMRNGGGALIYSANNPPDWVEIIGLARQVDIVNTGPGNLSGVVMMEQLF